MVIEIRRGVAYGMWEPTEKKHKVISWSNGNVLYIDWGISDIGKQICQNSFDHTLKICDFNGFKLQ